MKTRTVRVVCHCLMRLAMYQFRPRTYSYWTPVNVKLISSWTQSDQLFSGVFRYIQEGWPAKCGDEALHPFVPRKPEFSTYGGCIL